MGRGEEGADVSLSDVDGSVSSFHFTYDATGPMSMTFYGTEYFYLKNAQGDVTGLVDSSGTQVVCNCKRWLCRCRKTTFLQSGRWLYANPQYMTCDEKGHAVCTYDATAFLVYINQVILCSSNEKAYFVPPTQRVRGKLYRLEF